MDQRLVVMLSYAVHSVKHTKMFYLTIRVQLACMSARR